MITLNFSKVDDDHFAAGEQHTWPLKVTAVSAEDGLTSAIFVWHVNAADYVDDGLNPYIGDRCECVASVHQLSTLPENDPEDPEARYQGPFYRSDVGLWHCLSLAQADELKTKLQADVLDLLENFRAAQNLAADESIDIESPLTIPV